MTEQHARLSASSSPRWMNCPGSVRLSEGLPDRSSPEAREGTAAHELAAWCLTGTRHTKDFAPKHIEVQYEEDGEIIVDPIPVDDEMRMYVQLYVEQVRIAAIDKQGSPLPIAVETRVSLEDLNPPEPMFGTVDVRIWHPDTRILDVWDLKYGRGVDVSPDSEQLLYYALGSVLAIKKRPSLIRLNVHQPRIGDPTHVKRHELTFEELLEFKTQLMEAAEAVQDPDAPTVVGEKQCKFCLARGACPALARNAEEVAMVEFSAEVTELTSPDLLSPEEVARVLQYAPMLRDWLSAVEGHVTHQILEGESVPGWKVVEGRSHRRWADADRAEQYLRRKFGVDKATVRKVISPAQAEKLIRQEKMKQTTHFKKLWEKPTGRPTLVPETDKRPALEPGTQAAQEFDALPQGE